MSCNGLPQPIPWFPPAPPAGLSFQQQMVWRNRAFAQHTAAVRAANAKAHAACVAKAKAAAAAAAHAAAVHAAAVKAAAARALAAAKSAKSWNATKAAYKALGTPRSAHAAQLQYQHAERIAAAAHPLGATPTCGPLMCLPGMSHATYVVYLSMIAMMFVVGYITSWGCFRRTFQNWGRLPVALAAIPGALIVGSALDIVFGAPFVLANTFFGGAIAAFIFLGWLLAGFFVYLSEVLLMYAGWRRTGVSVGFHHFFHPAHFVSRDSSGGGNLDQVSSTAFSNALLTFFTKEGFRYLFITMATAFGILVIVSMLKLLAVVGVQIEPAHGAALMAGMAVATLFHPPSWLTWNFVFNTLAKVRGGLHRTSGHRPPPLSPEAPSRGTWLVDAPSATRFRAWAARQSNWPANPLPFGTQIVAPPDELLHTKILGATGSGKSTAIRAMLRTVAQRPNQRCIIADPDGGYAARFFNAARGDIILNPFDARASGWNLFADIRAEYDADNIAAALVPEKSGEQSEWGRYAQSFVSSCIQILKTNKPDATPADLWRMIATVPPAVLAGQLASTEAAHFLARGNEKMFGSVRSTAAGTAKGLGYLRTGGQQVSLADYAQGNSRGWIFLTYTAEQIAALKSVYAAMLRVLIFALMSRPEGDSGTWLVIDELDALGKIPGLIDALARLRKFGGRCVLGFQTIGQLEELYGKNVGAALVENCANTMILRCGGRGEHGTSSYAASLLGKREVLKSQTQSGSNIGTSQGQQNQGWNNSTTTSQQIEDTILASEIEQFANLSGVCHAPHFNFWSHFTLEPDAMPQVARAFEPRPVSVPTGPDSGPEPAGEPA